MRVVPTVTAVLAVFIFALSTSVFAQSLFEGQPEQHAGHEAQEVAVEKESIFCPTMRPGQVCTHGTAAILGLNGQDTEEWTTWARKYNRAVNAATEQLFADAEGKLNPQQMELLKAWFAIGWNPQVNAILYGKKLDDIHAAEIEAVKELNPRRNRNNQ